MIEKNYRDNLLSPKKQTPRGAYFLPHCAQTRCDILGAPQFLQTINRSFFIAK